METIRKSVHPKAHVAQRRNAMYRTFASIYTKGLYHVFYECFPFALSASRRYCGHAVSEDLLTWRIEPIAIYPTKDDDEDGALSGSVILDQEENPILFYVGIKFTQREKDDLNTAKPGSPIKTSLMTVSSKLTNGHLEFDNVANKKTLFHDEDLVKAGYLSGSMKDPEAYLIDGELFITFIAKKKEGVSSLVFLKMKKGSGTRKAAIVGEYQLSSDYSLESFRWFQSEGKDLVLVERTDSNGAKKVFVAKGRIDFEKLVISYDESTETDLDEGDTLMAPKIAYDSRELPYVIGALEMEHEIKGSRGMLSLPRRISVAEDGKIGFEFHPMVIRRMTSKDRETSKIKQTHFPLLASFTMEDSGYISLGNFAIFFNSNTLNIDRRKALGGNPGCPKNRKNIASLKIEGEKCPVTCIMDQDVFEIQCGRKTVTFITCDTESKIKVQGIENLEMFTVNPTKG